MIYRVVVTPSAGASAGKELQALLLAIGYNASANRFEFLFAGVDDKQNKIKRANDTQISKLEVRGEFK